MPTIQELALKAAVHIDSRNELPEDRRLANYSFTAGGCTVHVLAGNTERQLLDHLRTGTIFSASRMAMGHYIHRLRVRGHLPITTYYYRDPTTGISFGVYALSAPVRYLGLADEQLAPASPMRRDIGRAYVLPMLQTP